MGRTRERSGAPRTLRWPPRPPRPALPSAAPCPEEPPASSSPSSPPATAAASSFFSRMRCFCGKGASTRHADQISHWGQAVCSSQRGRLQALQLQPPKRQRLSSCTCKALPAHHVLQKAPQAPRGYTPSHPYPHHPCNDAPNPAAAHPHHPLTPAPTRRTCRWLATFSRVSPFTSISCKNAQHSMRIRRSAADWPAHSRGE